MPERLPHSGGRRARPSDRLRLPLLAVIVVTVGAASLGVPGLRADAGEERRFVVTLTEGRVAREQRVLKVLEGQRVRIEWRSDRPLTIHVHGYDIEAVLQPGTSQVTAFDARLTGRFPVERHAGTSESIQGTRHSVLMYLEVHPR